MHKKLPSATTDVAIHYFEHSILTVLVVSNTMAIIFVSVLKATDATLPTDRWYASNLLRVQAAK